VPDARPIRLTELSHGGGCGCKISPQILSEILSAGALRGLTDGLLVGTETADDAAVYRLNDHQALIATADFFTPIVDDPFDFGRIAATNALSDVYAMGGRPIMALALVGMPLEKLEVQIIRRILEGGESVCAAAGIPIAGGHSIDTLEPIYGLVGLGLVHPSKVKRNCAAHAGDSLVLGKPLGVGILSAALKSGQLSAAGYTALIDATTRLNTPGPELAEIDGVHALTDITGFGLAGHLLEICRGAKLSAHVEVQALPVLAEALDWVKRDVATGASERNWRSYGHEVELPAGAPEWQRDLLTDPQTSGGLLVACSPTAESSVLEVFARHGFGAARRIGGLAAGPARLFVQ
jgi:selenide, water dikinase